MYICQLGGSKLLKLFDNKVEIEDTGYPVPPCCLMLGDKVITGQWNVLKYIFSYEFSNFRDFILYASSIDKAITFKEFKYTVMRDNIGGGCPERLQLIGKYILDDDFSEIKAFFATSLPYNKNILDIHFPEDDFLSEYSAYIYNSYIYKINKPNRLYRNNIIMIKNTRGSLDKHKRYLVENYKRCMLDDYKLIYRYLTIIKASSKSAYFILSDSIENDIDIDYFYTKVSGCSVCDGYSEVIIDGNKLNVSFVCVNESLKEFYEGKKSFVGEFERIEL